MRNTKIVFQELLFIISSPLSMELWSRKTEICYSQFFMVLVTFNGDVALKMGKCKKRQMVTLMNTKKKTMCIPTDEWILTHISYEKDYPNKTEWASHPTHGVSTWIKF